MDIFIINKSYADNIKPDVLYEFQNKNISDSLKLKEHCFSYYMLDWILKDIFNIMNRDIEFVEKKPYLITREKFFSLSHSKKYIAIGISNHECGIDIEKIKQRDFKAISERMNFKAENLKEFYFEWTKYEAEYKLGEISKSINQTEFDGYIITAVSLYPDEQFQIHIQNQNYFSNLKLLFC